MTTQHETVLKKVKDLSALLSAEGKVDVLNYLLGELTATDLARLSPTARQALLETLPEEQSKPTIEAVTGEAPSIRQSFIEKYEVRVLADSQIALTLPLGTSRINFLKEAQTLANELHGRNAISPIQLEEWARNKNFTHKVTQSHTISVDMHVENSRFKTIAAMKHEGWLNLFVQDLAIAHAAYFIVTGKNAFQGGFVRVRFDEFNTGTLGFSKKGLAVEYPYGRYSRGGHLNVVASRFLIPQK